MWLMFLDVAPVCNSALAEWSVCSNSTPIRGTYYNDDPNVLHVLVDALVVAITC